MALTTANGSGVGGGGGATILSGNPTRHPYTHLPTRRHVIFPLSSRTLHVAVSAKKFSSRTGRFDGKNRRSTTTTRDQELEEGRDPRMAEIKRGRLENGSGLESGGGSAVDDVDDGYFLPKLPGEEKDFWEGEQWDTLGVLVEYLWAFGIVFALIACGIAVATYNEGATDFKDTPVYKESVQSRELLEEPEASNPDVFESNPTEVAPSLE
ncbi:AT-rich interactive domain protein [Trema orientale]|uniref:AT-rich interactive domain protein n=1 Tax=Trema orientale TaxID=63057 RepID=A0A2P5F9L3_TREOI|nr:AT-rich interactive domain protein [Trema orientale]